MVLRLFVNDKMTEKMSSILRLLPMTGFLLAAWVLLFSFFGHCEAQSLHRSSVAVLKSKELVPYNLAQQGFQDILGNGKESVFTLDDKTLKGKQIFSEIRNRSPRLLHVIGTPAAKVIVKERMDFPVVVSMILNPDIVSQIKGPVAQVELLAIRHHDIVLESRMAADRESS